MHCENKSVGFTETTTSVVVVIELLDLCLFYILANLPVTFTASVYKANNNGDDIHAFTYFYR